MTDTCIGGAISEAMKGTFEMFNGCNELNYFDRGRGLLDQFVDLGELGKFRICAAAKKY